MFNEFKPKRPNTLTAPDISSDKIKSVFDKGYAAYCKNYYNSLGKNPLPSYHNILMAEYAGLYTIQLALLSYIGELEL